MIYGNTLFIPLKTHERYTGKWFEPRGISYMFSVIIRVRVVLRKS